MSARDRLTLFTAAAASLLGILDTTIMDVAIPQAAAAVGLAHGSGQWLVTVYALTFGATLLLGGRVADYWGRKKAYLLGIGVFAAASLWGGLASTAGELLASRAAQGAGAAIMAPAALAIVTTTFPTGRERNRVRPARRDQLRRGSQRDRPRGSPHRVPELALVPTHQRADRHRRHRRRDAGAA